MPPSPSVALVRSWSVRVHECSLPLYPKARCGTTEMADSNATVVGCGRRGGPGFEIGETVGAAKDGYPVAQHSHTGAGHGALVAVHESVDLPHLAYRETGAPGAGNSRAAAKIHSRNCATFG